MNIHFYKYHGTGNDFIMIDDREQVFDRNDLQLVRQLCDRKFGIGADGLILLGNLEGFDFEMVYFNADGSQSMCGNGARCAVAFAEFLEMIRDKAHFMAIDGPHQATLEQEQITLAMRDVGSLSNNKSDFFVDTGSPHHIRFVENIMDYPILSEGAEIRYSDTYQPEGTNVNFLEKISSNGIFVRTYERGVENETLSCGTGVTACALVFGYLNEINEVDIKTLGGMLKVKYSVAADGSFHDILLIGPAKQVFKGEINIKTLERSS
ncbi:diaminopimelate epimerase [Pararhodonellum marinum]|uniref:diaminopimelate epimerase n=1 Tax=Pararhodonellum marinum TaxID=2755358 RepID=UPI00188E8963|nr:diaminopimelate epimerase [Pararhodonellum marinum]